MKKFLFLALLFFDLAAVVSAQDTPKIPKWELFGGYSEYLAGGGIAGEKQLPSNGVQVSVYRVVTNYFRIAGEFNAQFADHIVNIATLPPGGKHVNSKELLAVFGPEATYRGLKKFDIFGHYLIGVAYGRDNTDPITPTASDTTWIYGLGGGIDRKLGKRVSIRLLEFDWMSTHFPINKPEAQDDWRLATGFVFHFGN